MLDQPLSGTQSMLNPAKLNRSVGSAAASIAGGRLARSTKASHPPERASTLVGLQSCKAIERALADDELELYYQPKLHLRSNSIDSVEALLRWSHPEFGFIPPIDIIAVLEACGRVRALTEWVMHRAIADQARLALSRPMTMYVNLSGVLLADAGFAASALAIAGSRSGTFGFEITETGVIANPEAALAHLDAFVEAGLKLAIDDYGSGLSSLAYLKRLPAQQLKIDKMFVSGMAHSHRDPLLVRSTIDLAHGLGLEVTAEGVETQAALALLRVMNCDHAQGYLIARPMPIDRLEMFLADEGGLDHLSRADPSLALAGDYW